MSKTDASEVDPDSERHFEIGARLSGTTRFQWRFVGTLLPDNGFVIVRGAFWSPRIFRTFFMIWFIGVGLFAALSAVMAVAEGTPAMWLMPVGALIIAAIGYVTLLVGRAMTERALRRIALDLDRWADGHQ